MSFRIIKYCKKEHNIARDCITLKLDSYIEYREIEEEKLRDRMEGMGNYSVSYAKIGNIEVRNSYIGGIVFPNTFIFSACMEEVDPATLDEEYDDKYYINGPHKFFEIITNLLHKQLDLKVDIDQRQRGLIKDPDECYPYSRSNLVIYRGRTFQFNSGRIDSLDTMWEACFTKPIQFQINKEFRFAAVIVAERRGEKYDPVLSTSRSKFIDISDELEEIKKIVSLD